MLGGLEKLAYRHVGVGIVLAAALSASGCASPSLSVFPGGRIGPTVGQIQDHLRCVLVKTMDRHLRPDIANDATGAASDDYRLWKNLEESNFLGTINLTLFVTETEGLNPSLNFIRPLTSTGAPIKKFVESGNGLTTPISPTGNSFNLTLAVGAQVSGTQDRNFVLTYVVDMHRLYSMMYGTDAATQRLIDMPNGLVETCGGRDYPSEKGSRYSLQGDLQLEETLQTGLSALQRIPYSPVTAGSAGASKAGQSASTASVTQSAGSTAFSTKVDFTLAWAVNGGPTWTLLKIKGPSGSNPFLAYSRSKQDTLIATFGATCKADTMYNLADLGQVYQPLLKAAVPGPTTFEVNVYRRRQPIAAAAADATTTETLDARTDHAQGRFATDWTLITVALPAESSGLSYTYVSAGTGVMSIDPLTDPSKPAPDHRGSNKNATIAWTGFAGPKGYFTLRGSLADAQSGTFVGYIYLDVAPDGKGGSKINSLLASRNAFAALYGEDTVGPPDYWSSLPTCSSAGPFLPNGLNILQQLPGSVSAPLEQR